MIEQLLVEGANIEHTDEDRRTPLLVAAHKDHIKVVRVLLSNDRSKANIHATDYLERNVLHLAVDGGGDIGLISLLLTNGADPNIRDVKSRTPLHYCIRYNKSHAAQSLLDVGADPNARDVRSMTPLHYDFRYNRSHKASSLLEVGADPKAQDLKGRTPLHYCIQYGWRHARLLLSFGADPNAQDVRGETPLHYCVHYNRMIAFQTLLDVGALKEVTDGAGETPLSSAFRLGRSDLVEVLLNAGAVIVDSRLRLSSAEIKHKVAEHLRRSKLKIDTQVLKDMEHDTGFESPPEQLTQASFSKISQSQQAFDGSVSSRISERGDSSIVQVGSLSTSKEKMDTVGSSDLTDRDQCNTMSHESLVLASTQENAQQIDSGHKLDMELSKDEDTKVSLMQRSSVEALDAEAISDLSSNSNLVDLLLSKEIEEASHSDMLETRVGGSSATQETKGYLRKSSNEIMINAQQDVSTLETPEVLPAGSKAAVGSALRPSNSLGPTKPIIPSDEVTCGKGRLRQKFHSVARLSKVLAESLGFREKPLESGLQRVRWTCVCGYVCFNQLILS